MTLEEEKKIVEKAQKDSNQFAPLYEYYYPKIHSYIYRRINNKEVADDLTSQTFEKAIKRINNFRWQGVSVGVWLYKIARNNLNDYFRKTRRTNRNISLSGLESVIIDEQEESLEDTVIRSDEESILYKALQQFKKEDQYLIYYKFFEDMSNKEIAVKTGLSETNVGTKLHRLRTKLKKIILDLEKQNNAKTDT